MYSHDLRLDLGRALDWDIGESWYRTVKLIETKAPELFESSNWHWEYSEDLEALVEFVRSSLDKPEHSGGLPRHAIAEVARWLSELPEAGGISRADLTELADECHDRISGTTARTAISQIPAASPPKTQDGFDVEALFKDL
ncbi:MAG: hypothetical protein ABUT39_06795 [Acidobacteriota bacterium]